MKEVLESYKDLIDGLVILSSDGMLIDGYLPSGWSEESVYFGVFPIVNILKNITSGNFVDITETAEYTMVITTPDREIYLGAIAHKSKAPLGFLLTSIQDIYSEYLKEHGTKEQNIEEILERWRKNLS